MSPKAVLIGPPGAGKSTIGRKLSTALGVDLYDTDAAIEREAGRTIAAIFTEDGEEAFRRIEERIVARAIDTQHGIISLGGGAILSAGTRAALRGHTVILLDISVAEGVRRTRAHSSRPILASDNPATRYRQLMKTRRPLYREVATVRVSTEGRSPTTVVQHLLSILAKSNPADTPDPEEKRGSTQ